MHHIGWFSLVQLQVLQICYRNEGVMLNADLNHRHWHVWKHQLCDCGLFERAYGALCAPCMFWSASSMEWVLRDVLWCSEILRIRIVEGISDKRHILAHTHNMCIIWLCTCTCIGVRKGAKSAVGESNRTPTKIDLCVRGYGRVQTDFWSARDSDPAVQLPFAVHAWACLHVLLRNAGFQSCRLAFAPRNVHMTIYNII